MAYFRAGTARATHEAQQINVAKTPLASFESNVSGLYLPEILAYFSATQAGTGDPSPSNPRAISGVSEVTTACNAVNQWDEQWEVGGYDTTTGQKNTATNRIRNSNYIVVSPSTIYYFVNANVAYQVFFYTASKTYISNTAYNANAHEISIPDNCRFINFQMGGDYGTTYNNDVSINYPATDTAYHAYTGTTATTALGGTYYGGFLNLETGVLTITHVYVDLGSLNWTYRSGYSVFTAYKSEIKLSSDAKGSQAICSFYRNTYGDTWSGWANFPDKNISSGCNYMVNVANIVVKDTDYTEVNDFKTAVTGQTLVYELATPQTVQLTPAQIEQLLGTNNVFCSTGDVAVKFWKID